MHLINLYLLYMPEHQVPVSAGVHFKEATKSSSFSNTNTTATTNYSQVESQGRAEDGGGHGQTSRRQDPEDPFPPLLLVVPQNVDVPDLLGSSSSSSSSSGGDGGGSGSRQQRPSFVSLDSYSHGEMKPIYEPSSQNITIPGVTDKKIIMSPKLDRVIYHINIYLVVGLKV
jgi:hypothetical protein